MADVLQSNGLVLYVKNGAGVLQPFACAKTSTISITKDLIELAPKSSTIYRQYINGRASFTISGTGLIKVTETTANAINFFDNFIKGVDTIYDGKFEMIDPQSNYKKYSFQCYITELTLESTLGSIPTYSFTLQGVGGFTEIL